MSRGLRSRSESSRARPWLVIATFALCWLAPHSVWASPCWAPPVGAPITDPFREPSCRWCSGNRGIEYATVVGDPVRAVATGEVTFAGTIAGIGYVVVRHADGRRVTYGNVGGVTVGRGDLITRGSLVGTAFGPVHFGVRDGDRYVDPAPFIGELVGVVRLIPTDGAAAPAAPPPRLVCPGRADP